MAGDLLSGLFRFIFALAKKATNKVNQQATYYYTDRKRDNLLLRKHGQNVRFCQYSILKESSPFSFSYLYFKFAGFQKILL